MTNPPNIETVAQSLLESEFQKPEWQARLTSCPPRHLQNSNFPPSPRFPEGGTTMHFEMVCGETTVALLDKFVSPQGQLYAPEWRPQALLLGTRWCII